MKWKRWAYTAVILLLLWLGMCFVAVEFLTRAAQREISVPAVLKPFAIESVSLQTEDDVVVKSWLIRQDPRKVVILLAALRGNRSRLAERMILYLDKGYSVFAMDLRGTGESGGQISFGWRESLDLIAARKYLLRERFSQIAAHGISLGAATICYSLPFDYWFIVLESCYDNMNHAFSNRIAKFHIPRFCCWPVLWFGKRKLGVSLSRLSPLSYISRCQSPLFMMAGDSEYQLKLSETQALFAACSSQNKKLHIFKGGRHENFLKRFSSEYLREWNSFLSKQ